MTSSIPPNPWFSTINFNESFFASNTSSITLQYANANYLKRVGIATSVASNTSFSGNVSVDGILTCNNNVIVNNKSLDIDGALGQIRYADNKVQNTAYTGGTAGTYTSTNMTIDANGKISSISSGAIATQKTYTVQYNTNTSVTLPTDCIGISIRCIGKGGASGNASNSVPPATTWNAGGGGGAGSTITSAGIIPFTAGHVIQINFNFYTEVLSTTLSYSICRAGAGPNGSNATSSSGGVGGVPLSSSSTVNTSISTWSSLLGENGPNGGTNLAFQSATYPLVGARPICQSYNPITVFGAGQTWNGVTTSNSYQAPAISILGGICFITYYLK